MRDMSIPVALQQLPALVHVSLALLGLRGASSRAKPVTPFVLQR